MIPPILQYRPLDRGFLICLPGPADTGAWQRVLKALPGNLHGRDRLTPARARIFFPDASLVETHSVPLRWQRALPWLASLAPDHERLGGSLAYWTAALRLLQSLVIRGARLPQLETQGTPWRATWGISLTSPSDREVLDKLVKAMPPSAYAFPEDDMWVFTKGLGARLLAGDALFLAACIPVLWVASALGMSKQDAIFTGFGYHVICLLARAIPAFYCFAAARLRRK